MAIAFRAAGTTVSANNATTIVLNKPAGVVAGDALYACIYGNTTIPGGVTLSGWVSIAYIDDGGTNWFTVMRRIADGTEGSSFTFTERGSGGAGIINGNILAYQGVDNTTPEDATPTTNNGTGATLTIPSITTVTDQAWWVAASQTDGSATTLSQPSGFTTDQATYGASGDVTREDHLLIAPAGATGTTTSTQNDTGGWFTISLALRPVLTVTLPLQRQIFGFSGTYIKVQQFQALPRQPLFPQAGGTANLLTLVAATLGFTGPSNLTNNIGTHLGGGLSFTGPAHLMNAITRGLTAAVLSFTGALTKATTKGLAAATLTFTGPVNLVKQTGHKMAGALNFTGPTNLVKNIVKLMTGQLSFTGPTHLLNAITKNLAAAVLSFTGALTKFTTKTTFSATLSFTGALTAGKQFLRALTATLTFTGPTNLVKNINKNVSGTLTFTGPTHLLNSINKSMAAGLTFTGSLLRAITKNLTSATLTFAGTVVKSTRKTLVGAVLAFTGTFTKQTNKALSAVLSFTGSAHLLNSTGKNVSGVLSFTGKQSRAMTKNLTAATLTFTGALTKTTSKLLAGALSFVGAVVSGSGAHQFTQVLSAALNFSGAFVKQTDKTLVASLAFAGHSLVNNITKGMTAVLSFTGRLSKATTKTTFTATLTFTGRFVKQAQKPFTGVLSFTGPTALKKTFIKTFAAALNFVGGLLQPVPPQPAKQKNLLETVQANIDLATTETYPYQIDLTNYLSTGDSIGGYYITMIQIPEGNAVAPPWRGNVTFNGNIMIIPLLGSAFQLGQKYQMNVTFVANTNKVVTFLTYIHIVN